jgi:hypothetical protein
MTCACVDPITVYCHASAYCSGIPTILCLDRVLTADAQLHMTVTSIPPESQDAHLQLPISAQPTAFATHLTSQMPLNDQPSHHALPPQPRSLIHTLTIALSVTLSVTLLATILVSSFLQPNLLLSLTSSLTPITIFIAKTTAKLFALCLLYSLAQALHLGYYMMKRQDQRNEHRAQLFGHANVYFVDEWYVLLLSYRLGALTDLLLENAISPSIIQAVGNTLGIPASTISTSSPQSSFPSQSIETICCQTYDISSAMRILRFTHFFAPSCLPFSAVNLALSFILLFFEMT